MDIIQFPTFMYSINIYIIINQVLVLGLKCFLNLMMDYSKNRLGIICCVYVNSIKKIYFAIFIYTSSLLLD